MNAQVAAGGACAGSQSLRAGRGVHRAALARRPGCIVVASDGVVLCPTASCPCASSKLLEVVFAAHDAVHDNLLVGDELLCLELLLLGMELRDLRDDLTSKTHGCVVAPSMLTETTLLPALIDAVRDPRTPIHAAGLLTRVAFGLRRAWASADERE